MGNLSKYRSDADAMKAGIWAGYGDRNDPINFRIGYFQHGLAEEVAKLSPEDRKLAREDRLPASALLSLIQRAMSTSIILDWSNMHDYKRDEDGAIVLDADGNPESVEVPYSVEKAAEILADPEYEDLHEWILSIAKDRVRYRKAFVAESAGN